MSNIAGVAGAAPALKEATALRYTISTPDTEELVTLPLGTRTYTVTNVGSRFIKVAYATGDIADNKYFTLAPWESRAVPGTLRGTLQFNLYVSSVGLETLEFDIWR
jgi:hypothetical protein